MKLMIYSFLFASVLFNTSCLPTPQVNKKPSQLDFSYKERNPSSEEGSQDKQQDDTAGSSNTADDSSNSDSVVEVPSSPSDVPEVDGAELYAQNCMNCHGSLENSTKRERSVETIKHAIDNTLQMKSLKTVLNDEQVEAIAAVLKSDESSFVEPELVSMCEDPNAVAQTDAKVLTKSEYSNIVKDLFGSQALSEINSEMVSLGERTGEGTFTTFSNTFSKLTISAMIKAAKKIGPLAAQKIIQEESCLADRGHEIIQDIPESCRSQIVTSWGLKLLRRPLTLSESTSFLELFTQLKATSLKEGIGHFIESAMLHPDFLFRFEDKGNFNGQFYTLSSFEKAQRLSFGLWESLPDEELFNAARDNQLTTTNQLKVQVERMLQDPKAKRTLSKFYEEWLHLDEEKTNSYTSHFLDGDITKSNADNVYPQAVEEVKRFVEHVTFNQKGNYSDLHTSRWVDVGGSSSLARIYNIDPQSNMLPASERAGVLTRAAFHITGTNWQRPMSLGTKIRRNILCDDLPDPPDDAVPDFDPDSGNATGELLNSRDRFELAVSPPACIGCHEAINGLAFAFSHYDSLGRNISSEKTYDSTANYLGDVAIDSESKPQVHLGSPEVVKDGVDLSLKLAEKDKAVQCFAKSYVKFAKGREIMSGDGCLVESAFKKLKSKESILDVVADLYTSNQMYRKKVRD